MSDSARRDPFVEGLPTLERGAFRLRQLVPADREAVYRLYCDKEAVRFGFAPKMESAADADELIARTKRLVDARDVYHWGVARCADDQIVGHATLFKVEAEQRRAEIGYSVRRDEWGRGVATAAVAILIEFAFGAVGLRRLEADVDPRNVGSLRVLDKLGFVREGYMRERWELGGEIQDTVFFGLLRSEWKPPPPAA